MAGPSVTCAQMLVASAALNNDAAQAIYTNAAQLPYYNMALLELQELYELNEIPVVDTVSTVIEVPDGTTTIAFAPSSPIAGTPYLPDNLVEPTKLWESPDDLNQYVSMTKVNSLPLYNSGVAVSQFQIYTWESQEIRLPVANADIDIKMEYIRSLFTPVTDTTTPVTVLNTRSFLQFRTASLCALFIGEDRPRHDSLKNDAGLAFDRALGIGTKGRQNITTRRRPFRSSFKSRS